ncbi:MAG: epoxyqueuosine reductase QueH [Clostridiales bacterium]|nr:epoxyqueuosine reductase QueH [Clostridiales bacterium]
MNKINYDLAMQEIIKGLNGRKQRLLMHVCCAPCATTCIERLMGFFDITLYFYNPNIDGEEEFSLREAEVKRLAKEFKVNVVTAPFEKDRFYQTVKGLEDLKEGGARCERCFELRLAETAKFCKQNGFDFFATSLTLSPLKNAFLINKIGCDVAEKFGVGYLQSDFKKRNGYLRSIELSKEYGLYRQNYCGCEFSKNKTAN